MDTRARQYLIPIINSVKYAIPVFNSVKYPIPIFNTSCYVNTQFVGS